MAMLAELAAHVARQLELSVPPVDTVQRVAAITLSSQRITKIQDPDGDSAKFNYGATSWWIHSITDRRGHYRVYEYDSAQRIARANNDVGAGPWTETYITNAENSTVVWLDRYGAPRKIVNALGYTTRLRRDDANWPGFVTQVLSPNGPNVVAVYDGRGHLVTSRDSSTYDATRSHYATTTYQWDVGYDAVTRITKPEGDFVEFAYDSTTCSRLWTQPGGDTTRRTTFWW